MICIDTNQPAYYKDLLDVAQLYFGLEQVCDTHDDCEFVLEHRFAQEGPTWTQACRLLRRGEPLRHTRRTDAARDGTAVIVHRFRRRYAKLCLYQLLKDYFGFAPPWGGLTGIRPTKLIRQLEWEGMDFDEAIGYMRDVFDVSEGKMGLIRQIHQAQRGIYRFGDEPCYDVYVGIPFCRTRCLYCSFFSAAAGNDAQLDDYTAALCREIDAMGGYMRQQGKKVRAIYVGGGTPTALGDARLEKVLAQLYTTFGYVAECTVEAGRPDTVTPDTFAMLKAAGVTRVSINPQTMNARTLEIIGRDHTPGDILRAYSQARAAGIAAVNMDIIVGLPGEDVPDVAETLRALGRLDIDNLTVHTLAVKRSSRLKERLTEYRLPTDEQAQQMLDLAQRHAATRGMRPYYMYRQKYMRGNLENVGYALPGSECVYNVDMMEETHSILGLGAGSMCKRMYFDKALHTRLASPKDVTTYLKGHAALIAGKKEFFSPDANLPG